MANIFMDKPNDGTKLIMLRKNLNIFFEIDMMTDMRNWQSVIVYRKFEELKNEEAKKREISFFGCVCFH